MNMITLNSSVPTGVTVISNRFIEEYMPKANGEFVKVYLYLVRILSDAPSFSLEIMADHLLCTEKDIFRALKYWEKEKLMSFHYDKDGEIIGITFCSAENIPPSAPVAKKPSAPRPENTEEPLPQIKNLPPDRMKELKQDKSIMQILYVAEQYFGRSLTSTEMQRILYFYDELHFAPELVEYLVEYCVNHNHKSIHYMEKVALSWAKEGITSVEAAKNTCARYGKEYYIILKALGISNRAPIDNEIALIDRWIKEYGFDMDIVLEACSRTVLRTGQGSFQYADKILSEWKDKKVHSLSDIHILDAEYKKRKLEKAINKPAPTKPQAQSPNRFNNFEQRTYDFVEYEKRLLNQ